LSSFHIFTPFEQFIESPTFTHYPYSIFKNEPSQLQSSFYSEYFDAASNSDLSDLKNTVAVSSFAMILEANILLSAELSYPFCYTLQSSSPPSESSLLTHFEANSYKTFGAETLEF
jgi:hypothetical protein